MAGIPFVRGLFGSSTWASPNCCGEWLVNWAPSSVSMYQGQSASELCPLGTAYFGSPPAPCVPMYDPPFSTHVLNASRCSGVRTSPLLLFQITSLNFDSCSLFITAPFSVTKYG